MQNKLQSTEACLPSEVQQIKAQRSAYKIGINSALGVYQSQQTYYPAEQTMISKYLSQATNLVTLYKVLAAGLCQQTSRAEHTCQAVATSQLRNWPRRYATRRA